MSQVAVSADATKTQVAEEIKFDILAGVPAGGNELKRSQIARTFICQCLSLEDPYLEAHHTAADTITGLSST